MSWSKTDSPVYIRGVLSYGNLHYETSGLIYWLLHILVTFTQKSGLG